MSVCVCLCVLRCVHNMRLTLQDHPNNLLFRHERNSISPCVLSLCTFTIPTPSLARLPHVSPLLLIVCIALLNVGVGACMT